MNTAKLPTYVSLAATLDGAQLRTQVYAGVEHLVVPVVALVGDAVVEGMLSNGPELVPADVLAAAPSSWNGRPVVAFHPLTGANEPETWDKFVFGQIFSAEFSDNRLRMEAFLDPAAAQSAGDDAVEVINKALAGEMIEVSVGAWVWMEEATGVNHQGRKYTSKWVACIPDHLAMGLQTQGGVGACSNEDGCGGMRVNANRPTMHLMTSAQALDALKETFMPTAQKSFTQLALETLTEPALATLAEGMSDIQLRQSLEKALRALVPGFWGVAEVFADSSTCVFMAMPGDSVEFWEASFTMDGGNATIGRRKQVEPVTKWEKVKNATSSEIEVKVNVDTAALNELQTIATNLQRAACTMSANCGGGDKCSCNHKSSSANTATPVVGDSPAALTGKGASLMSKKELVGRLVANAATKLTDADVEKLNALSEEQLTALVALVDKPAEKVEVKVEVPATPDPNLVTFTADEAKAMRAALARENARETAHRADLVKGITEAGTKYTEQQLAAKTTEDLELLADTLGLFDESAVPDFSGRGLHAVAAANATDNLAASAPPDPWKVAGLGKALGYRTQ